MTETEDVLVISTSKKPVILKKRLWIGIPLGLALLGLGYAVYTPGVFLAGMMTDSCSSGSNSYLFWTIWVQILWAIVLFINAVVPAVLVITGRRWRWVLLSLLLGAVGSIIWIILWLPVLMISGC